MTQAARNICTCGNHGSGLQVLNTYDPTRTTTLRNQFASEMGRRFKKIRGLIRQAIVDQDCFGLRRQTLYVAGLPGHRAFDFPTSSQKLAAFEDWLSEQVDAGIFEMSIGSQIGSGVNDQWTDRYITTAYQKGVVRARNEMRAAGMDIPILETDDMVQAAFNQPFHLDRVGLVSTRVYSDLRGITAAMDTQISRVLGQGIADGDGPIKLAQLLTKTISGPVGDLSLTDTLGRFIPAERRAKILARTEIIRAHHAATMQEYKNWGLEGVKVRAEWTTAGDGRVCDACSALQGKVYTLKEIENKIPLHPQCRCIALPVIEDEVSVVKEGRISSALNTTSSGYYIDPINDTQAMSVLKAAELGKTNPLAGTTGDMFFTKTLGHSDSDWEEIKKLLRSHGGNAAQQAVSDPKIVDLLYEKSSMGDLMRDVARVETQLLQSFYEGHAKRIAIEAKKLRVDRKFHLEMKNIYEVERLDDEIEYLLRRPPPALYRKGEVGVDKVESWTTLSEGARTQFIGGDSRITPTMARDIQKMLDRGYQSIGGIGRMTGAPGEAEVTMVRLSRRYE